MKLKTICSWVYVIGIAIAWLLTPTFFILVVFKMCDATALSWIQVCIPLIVLIALSPIMAAAKFIIDAGGKNGVAK